MNTATRLIVSASFALAAGHAIADEDFTSKFPLRSCNFISVGGNVFARAVLGIPVHDCTGGYRCYRTAALRTLNLGAIRTQGYAFQVEMVYNFWKSGFRIRETPIIFEDRRVGSSKMSRKIFIEAFLWVIRTRFTGDRAVRRPPADAPALNNDYHAPSMRPDGADARRVSSAGDRQP